MNNHDPQQHTQSHQATATKSNIYEKLPRKIFPAINVYSVIASIISLAGFFGLFQHNIMLFGIAITCSIMWIILVAATKMGESLKMVYTFHAVDSVFTGVGVVALLPVMEDASRALAILAIGLVYFALGFKMFAKTDRQFYNK